MKANRRKFLRQSLASTAGLFTTTLPQAYSNIAGPTAVRGNQSKHANPSLPPVRFAVIGLNHGHIYGQVDAVVRGGGTLVSCYAKEPDLLAAFTKRYPEVKVARSENEILEDNTLQLIVSASIPVDRAPLGVRVMQHGKDYMVDKPGIITLKQFEEVKKVQAQTKKIYSIMYSERLENKATVKAGDLVKAGAIGKVIQTIGLGPHRMNIKSRPPWFFDRDQYGGILCDIGSHQFDQFYFLQDHPKRQLFHHKQVTCIIRNILDSKILAMLPCGEMKDRDTSA